MLDHVAAREAFRTRLLTLVVATTGSVTLAATTTGFTRSSGSFLTDGFAAGMEVVPTGFASNTAVIIQSVDALSMTIAGTRSAEASGAGRSLTVGLPVDRRWQGTQTPAAPAVATRPNVLEQWVPGQARDYGAMIDTGFYIVTWNALANKGIKAVFSQMQAIRDLFPPGQSFLVSADQLRVTGDPAPNFTQPITTDNGYETSTLSIPWRSVTTNLLSAPTNLPSAAVYATWNPSDKGTNITLSNGNLTDTASGAGAVRATIGKATGKWYWEITVDSGTGQSLHGIANASATLAGFLGGDGNGWSYFNATGNYANNGAFSGSADTWTTGDKIMVALDMDNGKVFFGKNGVWQSSGNPATGANPAFSGLTGTLYPANSYNSAGAATTNFGAAGFTYTVPAGFVGMQE